MLGALPPWRGVAPYTRHLLDGLEQIDGVELEFLDFTSLYPPHLYPGGDPSDRNGAPPIFQRVRLRRLLAWYNPLSWLWAGLTLRGRVVHAQWWSYVLAPIYLTILALARLRRRKVVLTLHNIAPHEGGNWQRRLNRIVFRLAHHFIVHSQRNAKELVSEYPPAAGKVTVVPHGLLSMAGTRNLSREEARRALELPLDRPVILAFGNIRPYKGLDFLLHALRRVLDAGQEPILAVVGQPWGSFEPYQRLIDELGLSEHVREWLDYVPDEQVNAFLSASDLAVFPYTHFGAQSGAATLVLSRGLPIIVSDVGALPDLVEDTRAVVPPNDSAALADAISAVLADDTLLEKLAADAKRQATKLDWGNIAQDTAKLYRHLIAN